MHFVFLCFYKNEINITNNEKKYHGSQNMTDTKVIQLIQKSSSERSFWYRLILNACPKFDNIEYGRTSAHIKQNYPNKYFGLYYLLSWYPTGHNVLLLSLTS